MATDLSFAEYVCEQLSTLPFSIRKRKMFGEYCVYVNEKPIILICDNTIFVAKLAKLDSYNLSVGFPYEGAKLKYIVDPDHRELLCEIALLVEAETPIKKK
jgi:TfoX/Sxy family transcriptional regulator of competence genes